MSARRFDPVAIVRSDLGRVARTTVPLISKRTHVSLVEVRRALREMKLAGLVVRTRALDGEDRWSLRGRERANGRYRRASDGRTRQSIERARLVLDAVRARPGATALAIANAVRLAHNTTLVHLHALRAEGLVKSDVGKPAHWTAIPRTAPAVSERASA